VQFPRGNPDEARNFDTIGVDKPFDIAIDTRGHAWVTSNATRSVVELRPDGRRVGDPITGDRIHRPMGVATDSFGNVWVADSGVMDPPCPTPLPNEMITEDIGDDGAMNRKAAVTLIRHRGTNRQVRTFGKETGKRDGLRLPWGIAVDGNDNVWVANFAGQTLMQLCGVREAHCPPGVRTGDPISPDSGYTFDGLVRNTGVQIDPSGNVWLANNWILEAFKDDHQNNPGGHELVVFIGLAAPIHTPLIGPPQQPGPRDDDKHKDDDDD
jgi:DNA-binding beta-propeller fold protein YncE